MHVDVKIYNLSLNYIKYGTSMETVKYSICSPSLKCAFILDFILIVNQYLYQHLCILSQQFEANIKLMTTFAKVKCEFSRLFVEQCSMGQTQLFDFSQLNFVAQHKLQVKLSTPYKMEHRK